MKKGILNLNMEKHFIFVKTLYKPFVVTLYLLPALSTLQKIYLDLLQSSLCQLSIRKQYIKLFNIRTTCYFTTRKKKKTRYILSIIIIVVASQVSKAKAGFIRNYKIDKAENSINCLFIV